MAKTLNMPKSSWAAKHVAKYDQTISNQQMVREFLDVFGISEFQDPHWLQIFFSACCASHLNRDPDPATRQARSRCRTNASVVPTVARPNCEKRTHQRCTNGNEINDVERVPLVHDITYITDDRHMTQRSQVAAPGHALCTRMRCLWGRGAEEQPPSSAADGQAQSLKHLKRRKHTVNMCKKNMFQKSHSCLTLEGLSPVFPVWYASDQWPFQVPGGTFILGSWTFQQSDQLYLLSDDWFAISIN